MVWLPLHLTVCVPVLTDEQDSKALDVLSAAPSQPCCPALLNMTDASSGSGARLETGKNVSNAYA